MAEPDPSDRPSSPSTPLRVDPTATYEDWHELVETEVPGGVEALATRLADGVEFEALSAEATCPTGADPAGLPGEPPYVRGTRFAVDGEGERKAASVGASWRVAQVYEANDSLEAGNARILADLEQGVSLLWLADARLDDAARFEQLLADVEPRYVDLVLDAGAAPEALLAWADDRDVPLAELRGGLGIDPLAALAAGRLAADDLDAAFGEAAERLRSLGAADEPSGPPLRALSISTVPFHDAGATQTQQLAWGLAAAVETLRRLDALGVTPHQAASHVVFLDAVSGQTFLEIARLRAARLLWSKALAACGALEAAAIQRRVVRTSAVELARRDVPVNLLRATSATVAAILGGADAVATTCFDAPLGPPSERARRVAVNTQHVLAEEAHLGRIADPAGGSWAIESRTDRLARAAWARFQAIEAAGGLSAALADGRIEAELEETVAARRAAFAAKERGLVGLTVSPVPNQSMKSNAAPPPDSLAAAKSSGDRAPGLPMYRPTAAFELASPDRSRSQSESSHTEPSEADR